MVRFCAALDHTACEAVRRLQKHPSADGDRLHEEPWLEKTVMAFRLTCPTLAPEMLLPHSQLAQLELAQLVLTTQNVFSTNRSTAQVYSRSGHLPKYRHNRLQEIPDAPPPRPKAGDAKVQDTFHEAPVKEISRRRRASVEGHSKRIERNRWIGPKPSLWPPSTGGWQPHAGRTTRRRPRLWSDQ